MNSKPRWAWQMWRASFRFSAGSFANSLPVVDPIKVFMPASVLKRKAFTWRGMEGRLRQIRTFENNTRHPEPLLCLLVCISLPARLDLFKKTLPSPALLQMRSERSVREEALTAMQHAIKKNPQQFGFIEPARQYFTAYS